MYIELQSVLEEEREAVMKRDYQRLYEVVSKKDSILTGLSGLASSRSALVDNMLKEREDVVDRGLKTLIGLQSGAERRALQDARDSLAGVRKKVGVLNERNRELIGASLGALGHAIDFLESFTSGGTYLSTGLRGGKSLKGVRLRKGV